jgi:hypothetical protein
VFGQQFRLRAGVFCLVDRGKPRPEGVLPRRLVGPSLIEPAARRLRGYEQLPVDSQDDLLVDGCAATPDDPSSRGAARGHVAARFIRVAVHRGQYEPQFVADRLRLTREKLEEWLDGHHVANDCPRDLVTVNALKRVQAVL